LSGASRGAPASAPDRRTRPNETTCRTDAASTPASVPSVVARWRQRELDRGHLDRARSYGAMPALAHRVDERRDPPGPLEVPAIERPGEVRVRLVGAAHVLALAGASRAASVTTESGPRPP
jgi:hypothetical protein